MVDEYGQCMSRSWLWFPKGKNHSVSIRHYEATRVRPEFWVLRVSSHKKFGPWIQVKLSIEPTDAHIRDALDVAFFFQDEEEILEEFDDNEILGMTIEVGSMQIHR
jgi:hypothetical protein